MPFPLAHPAAVLPLRRLCPRRFNFPALVIGSLCPDVGYGFGRLHLDQFSHRFLAGSFGFCLPVGLLLVLLFYRLRWPVVQRLPARHRRIFEPLCLRPAGSLWVVVISLLVGAWTHIFLDSLTHANGWLVEHLPVLQTSLGAGNFSLQVCDLLYSITTFVGVLWLALAYLNWLERAAETRNWIWPGFKYAAGLLLAAFTLLLSFASHVRFLSFGLKTIALLTALLVAGFFLVTGLALRNRPVAEHPSLSTVRHSSCNQPNQTL
jgi:hypothetical protein